MSNGNTWTIHEGDCLDVLPTLPAASVDLILTDPPFFRVKADAWEYEDLRRPFTVTPEVPYTDVWTFPTVGAYPGKHPCEKPQAILQHIITASSRPGAVVLDSFAGSGSTGRAALLLGRSFVGIEQDPQWCAAARAACEKPQRAQIRSVEADPRQVDLMDLLGGQASDR